MRHSLAKNQWLNELWSLPTTILPCKISFFQSQMKIDERIAKDATVAAADLVSVVAKSVIKTFIVNDYPESCLSLDEKA